MDKEPLTDINIMFDSLKLEAIEYQLIAVSLILLKDYQAIPTLAINQMYHIYREEPLNYSQEIQCIKSHDLNILNDNYIQQKCNLYLDSDYYCEYKIYCPSIFKQIMYSLGTSQSDIAKYSLFSSLLIRENIEEIINYIREDNSEISLNYVTSDKKYIVRAISKKGQRKFVKEMLKSYHERMTEGSLLQAIFCVFKLVIKGQIYRLMILENTQCELISGSEIVSMTHFASSFESFENASIKIRMEEKDKKRIEYLLEKDKQYLLESGIQYCSLSIGNFSYNRQSARNMYDVIMYGKPRFVEFRITDYLCNQNRNKARLSSMRNMLIDISVEFIQEQFRSIIQ